MKAAISYRCSCGCRFLVCKHAGEDEETREDWRDTVAAVADGAEVAVVDELGGTFVCPGCGSLHAVRPTATVPALSVIAAP